VKLVLSSSQISSQPFPTSRGEVWDTTHLLFDKHPTE
jgi:hypothetical protein